MKNGAPYYDFGVALRLFLKKKKYQSPSDFHRDLKTHMGTKAPSMSSVWMAFYGARCLPAEVIIFMIDRYGFEIDWHSLVPVRNLQGAIMKANQMSLPGMREISR